MEWKPINENTPSDDIHIRGLWVKRLLSNNRHVMEWQYYIGYVGDNNDFLTPDQDSTGWDADDYTHWLELNIPKPPVYEPLTPQGKELQ